MKARALISSIVLLAVVDIFAQGTTAPQVPANGHLPQNKSPLVDRRRLPSALQKTPLERLSSGALMLLDQDADLVDPPAAPSSKGTTSSLSEELAPVTLDLRVGSNIRLGDDPAALPSSMRSQAEPHIARFVGDPDLLVAAFQEGRFTTAGAVDCGYSVSHNGGLTWSRALIPGLTQASGGPYPRATDPVAGMDLSGNIYLNTDAAIDSNFNTGAVVVSRSMDKGLTFDPPRVVYKSPNSATFPDKNWMAINTFAGTPLSSRAGSNVQSKIPILASKDSH